GFRWSGSFWIALLTAMAAATLLGLIMHRWVYSPLLGQPPITTLIASIGVFIALEEIYRIVAGPEPYGFDVKLLLPDVRAAALLVTAPQLLGAVVTGALLLGLWLLLARTGVGLAIRAVSQDGEIATACGMDPGRIVLLTFAVGSALAGAAGMLVGIFYNSVSPTMGNVTAYKGLAIIV